MPKRLAPAAWAPFCGSPCAGPPGILAGAILVALNISKELTMTLLMRPTGVHTLATRLWSTTAGEVLDFRVAAPYALTLVLLTAAPTWLLVRTTLEPERR